MEKSIRKVKPSFIILILTYTISIITLLYFSYDNILKYNNERNTNKKLNSELNELKNTYNSLVSNKDKINSNINGLKNIDNTINSIKEQVFDLAKKIELKIQNNETEYKIAYLTFDDGPYYLTNDFLKILKEYKVKATFFTIGTGKEKCFDNKSKSCTDIYKKIVDNNHTIANHTYSHAIFNGLYNNVNSFMEQVNKQEDLIYSKTGIKTNILRFPGGSSTSGKLKNSIIEKLREKGYGWVDWTAQDGDGGNLTSKNQAWNNFKNSINSNIEVILFHDYDKYTYSILPDVIKYLEQNNYILLPLFYDSIMVNK